MGGFHGCFTLIVVLYLAVPAKSQLQKECTFKEVNDCGHGAPQSSVLYLAFGNSVDAIRRYCNAQFPMLLGCLDQVSQACEETSLANYAIDGVEHTYRFTCSERNIEEYARHLNCLTTPAFKSRVNMCNDGVQAKIGQAINFQNNQFRLCVALAEMVACIKMHVEDTCTNEAALFVEKYFRYILPISFSNMLHNYGEQCNFNVQVDLNMASPVSPGQGAANTVPPRSDGARTGYLTLDYFLIIALGILVAAFTGDAGY